MGNDYRSVAIESSQQRWGGKFQTSFKLSLFLVFLFGGTVANAQALEWPNIFGLTPSEEHYDLKLLGKFVFFDPISVDGDGNPADMSCASCHDPASGGTGPDSFVNQTQVAITGANVSTVGSLKPPNNQYASMVPAFHECNIGGVGIGPPGPNGIRYCGGNFYNGRAIGDTGLAQPGSTHVIGPSILGSKTEYAIYLTPTSDQALNPFANHVEQNVPLGEDGGLAGAEFVCRHVQTARYSVLYKLAWGEAINCDAEHVAESFQRIAVALGAYQASNDTNSFTSKRDFALRAELMCLEKHWARDRRVCRDPDYLNSPGDFPLAGLTAAENNGHDLFYNTCISFFGCSEPPFPELPATQCSFCHSSNAESPNGTGLFERYADDAYHNIGTPINRELPASAETLLASHLNNDQAVGGVRTPHLRNLTKRPYPSFVKAYGHNGYFKSLEGIVHFYNTAATKPSCEDTDPLGIGLPYTEAEALANNCWPAPEWPQTAAPPFLVGALGMTSEQEADLVAYLETLDDYATAREPRNWDIAVAVWLHLRRR